MTLRCQQVLRILEIYRLSLASYFGVLAGSLYAVLFKKKCYAFWLIV